MVAKLRVRYAKLAFLQLKKRRTQISLRKENSDYAFDPLPKSGADGVAVARSVEQSAQRSERVVRHAVYDVRSQRSALQRLVACARSLPKQGQRRSHARI